MPREIPSPDALSRREQDVLLLLMSGMSNKEIALTLGLSLKTVEEHLIRIYRKAGVTSRTQALLWGIEALRVFPH